MIASHAAPDDVGAPIAQPHCFDAAPPPDGETVPPDDPATVTEHALDVEHVPLPQQKGSASSQQNPSPQSFGALVGHVALHEGSDAHDPSLQQ